MKKNNSMRTCCLSRIAVAARVGPVAALSLSALSDVAIAACVCLPRPGRLLLYSTEKEIIGKEEE